MKLAAMSALCRLHWQEYKRKNECLICFTKYERQATPHLSFPTLHSSLHPHHDTPLSSVYICL